MAGSTFRSEIRRALTFWRRSIQARVVASIVVLSAVVVSAVGWVLLQQTQKGLLDHRVDAVLVEVNTAVAEANRQLDGALTSSDPNEQQTALGNLLVKRGGSRGFQVVLIGPVGAVPTIDEGAPILTRGLDTSSVPVTLEQHFGEVATTAWTYTSIRADGEPTVPGIVVGSQLQLPADGGLYTAYFLFPLDEEQETLALVTRAMVTAAALLLVLVAGLTWLVTRQVVTPVRMARRVAERLAAGQLQERLQVKGEDDLARLATSFNQMASNLQRQIRQLEELSRVQQQFVSDVSHELRTPLTTVRMAGDVLHDARRSFDPATVARGRAAAERARPVRDAAGRPARDQPLRRRCRRARPRRGQPGRRRAPGGRPDPGAGRPAAHPRGGRRPRPRVPGRGRRTTGGADRAQPGHQRHRPRRDARRRRPCRGRRPGGGDRGPRPRRRPAAR